MTSAIVVVDDGIKPVPGFPYGLFDAERISGVIDAGDLNEWINKGTLGLNATQTGVQRPTFYTNGGPTGGPRVWFNGTHDVSTTEMFTARSQIIRVALVFETEDLTSLQTVLHGESGEPQVLITTDGRFRINAGTSLSTDPSEITTDTWYWAICEFDGSNSSIELSTGTTASGNAGSSSHSVIRIGKAFGNFWFEGSLSFLALWDDGTSKASIKTYMQERWPTLV